MSLNSSRHVDLARWELSQSEAKMALLPRTNGTHGQVGSRARNQYPQSYKHWSVFFYSKSPVCYSTDAPDNILEESAPKREDIISSSTEKLLNVLRQTCASCYRVHMGPQIFAFLLGQHESVS